MIPIFKHDCDECKFLGSIFGKFDFYYHERDDLDEYVIRYGDKPGQYYSPSITKDDLNDIENLPKEKAIISAMIKRGRYVWLNEFEYADENGNQEDDIEETTIFEEVTSEQVFNRLRKAFRVISSEAVTMEKAFKNLSESFKKEKIL